MQDLSSVEPYFAPQPYIFVLGVKYLHLRLPDGAELYLTEDGLHFAELLLPRNHWGDPAWRESNRERLRGSSSVFRVTTKEVGRRSIDVVLKWNRMGQDIPGETEAAGALDGAEFNSPFMEFSLVREMRNTQVDTSQRLHTHKPLAIYVPNRFHPAEHLGRKQHRMESIDQTHAEIDLDWNRFYAVIYEWLKGIDAAEARGKGFLDHQQMVDLYERSNRELRSNGFCMRDNKPQHIIVRPKSGELTKDKAGSILYGLVDFELLERTPEREELVRAAKRREYLARQAKRFGPHQELLPGLARVTIMGVDYIYGEVESTGGALWVVGHDPMLFDYFLPEKWRRTPRKKLVESQRWYETTTRDDVHIVWRESRLGEHPDVDPFFRSGRLALAHGYNSPFEEFSIALELLHKGIDTKYPRAIYMTGSRMDRPPFDRSRFESHAELRTPDGTPILQEDHEYMTIWGFWNSPDDMLTVKSDAVYERIDALTAYRDGLLTEHAYLQLMRTTKTRLEEANIEDLSLCGGHLLLTFDKNNQIATDQEGTPLARIRIYELMKRVKATG